MIVLNKGVYTGTFNRKLYSYYGLNNIYMCIIGIQIGSIILYQNK